MKSHSFYVHDAEKHGVEKAVILYNLRFWLEKNQASNKNLHDGYYWTYNSAQAFTVLFPYYTASKVNRLLKQMENDGLILSGNYNKAGYDRTKWYSMPDFCVAALDNSHFSLLQNAIFTSAKWIFQYCKMDIAELQNAFFKSARPIPDINTDGKPDVNTDANDGIEFDDFWNAYGKKVDTAKCKSKWLKLTHEQHTEIMANVFDYVAANSDKQYRKNPLTYLNGQCWLDEIIERQPQQKQLQGFDHAKQQPKQSRYNSHKRSLQQQLEQQFAAEDAQQGVGSFDCRDVYEMDN